MNSDGFRQIAFSVVMPVDEELFAIIYDADALQGGNVRLITKETDPDFIENLRLFIEARHNCQKIEPNDPNPKDFGLVLKDSEFCQYEWEDISDGRLRGGGGGLFGGEFMHTGVALRKPGGGKVGFTDYDYENNTKTFRAAYYYYVGKE